MLLGSSALPDTLRSLYLRYIVARPFSYNKNSPILRHGTYDLSLRLYAELISNRSQDLSSKVW